jgi:hypothetical protein
MRVTQERKGFVVVLMGSLWILLAPDKAAGQTTVYADFNGDGFADLAIGAPSEDVNPATNAGGVNIIYGTAVGLSATGNQFWTQNSLGILDTAESADRFGAALAAGDFNGDGYADLAIGVPFEDVGTVLDAGGVHVLYGSASRLSATGNQFWTQDSSGILGTAGTGDWFGAALAVGDFNRDGFADLVIGVPTEQLVGGVNVFYGTATGLTAARNQLWTQDSAGVLETGAGFDRFGAALATGDFNRDSFTDLAIGVPRESVSTGGTGAVAGGVNVLYGSASGLSPTGNQFWSQNSPGILGTLEAQDNFGAALAAGDFNGDGYADLAIGVPNEDVGTVSNAGGVNVLYGSAIGLSATGNQFWTQNSVGILDIAEQDDEFGSALAAANFGGSGQADLAIGVPGEHLGLATARAGGVHVLYGSASRLSASGNQFWTQNSSGIPDTAEAADGLGSALSAANFGKSAHADLAIGVPGEDLQGTPSVFEAGGVHVLYGSVTGLSATANQFWTQNSPNIQSVAGADNFGAALAKSPTFSLFPIF